jgi:hypothetical protein
MPGFSIYSAESLGSISKQVVTTTINYTVRLNSLFLNPLGVADLSIFSLGIHDHFIPVIYIPLLALVFYLSPFSICVVTNSFGSLQFYQ